MAPAPQRPQLPPTRQDIPRWLLTTLVVLLAIIIGIAAALLDWASGARVPAAILKGGTAFAGSTGLALAILAFVVGGRRE